MTRLTPPPDPTLKQLAARDVSAKTRLLAIERQERLAAHRAKYRVLAGLPAAQRRGDVPRPGSR